MRESVFLSVTTGAVGFSLAGDTVGACGSPTPKDGEAEIFIHRFPPLTG